MKTDRLFVSPDEAVWRAKASPREEQPLLAGEAPWRKRFLLTTTSRAPEVNLFNQPRISLWPITTDAVGAPSHATGTRQDAFDKTLKFCTTIAGVDYFFSRSDARSAVYDWSIPRNQNLIGYLDHLSGSAIPGFGSSFENKYGATDRDALLVQMFDFIRSGPALLRLSDMNGLNTRPGFTLPTGGGGE